MALLKDVLFENDWSSASFHDSHEVNRLINTGLLTPIEGAMRQDIDGLSSENMKSVIVAGIIYRVFQEPVGMDASDNEITPNELNQKEYKVKTFYQAYSERVRKIQEDIMPMSVEDAKVYLVNFYGQYWATHWNNIMAYTIKGMVGISDIVVGDGTENFSHAMVRKARKMYGDKGYAGLGKFYMSSTTLDDILEKDESSTSRPLLSETYGQTTITKDGVTTVVQDENPTYKYNGVTPVEVDDAMPDGVIAIVSKGAFGIGERNISKPLVEAVNELAGLGSGVRQLVSRKSFVLHPTGFNFKGVLGTTFSKVSELSYAELGAGNQYEVAHDVKDTKIRILRVKIGA